MGTKMSVLKQICGNQIDGGKEGMNEQGDRFGILRIAALVFRPTSAAQ